MDKKTNRFFFKVILRSFGGEDIAKHIRQKDSKSAKQSGANELFFEDNTVMLFSDANKTV